MNARGRRSPLAAHPWARRWSMLALGLALAAPPARVRAEEASSGGGLSIEHDPPGCLAAGRYPRLTACFRPEEAVARGRVYFRARGTTDWFYVEMTGEPPCLEAVLPRPGDDAGAVEYALAVLDRGLGETRTDAYTVPVTANDTCPAGSMAPSLESAAVVIGSTRGTEPVGFLTGDGLGTGVLLGIAGGVAAVTAVALALNDEDEKDAPPVAAWRSTLAVPGGRGQVVVDGVPLAVSGPGEAVQSRPLGPGPHRLEAVLVDGRGQAGTWQFDLGVLDLAPGSLAVVAGQVEEVGPEQVLFRLAGKPGERVVLTFRLRGE